MLISIRLLSPFLGLILAAGVQAAPVPGTSVTLEPPAGFALSDRFAGFMAPASGASIAVSELPGRFAELRAAFLDDARLRAQGMTRVGHEALLIDQHQALWLETTQAKAGLEYRKWLLLVERPEGVALLVATAPEADAETLAGPLRTSLLNVRFGDRGDPAEALGFRITPVAPFKTAKVLGQTLILAPDGQFPVPSEQTPMMVIGLSATHGVTIAARVAFAEQRAAQTATLASPRIQATRAIKIAGLPGYVTRAQATDHVRGTPMTLYQVMLFDQHGYVLMQGLAPRQKAEAQIPLFDKMARSFAPKPR